ncbi:MAG: N,N-dimethylformamidase beta subunit family domain-containing protein, partial [Planctomycetaceae bacterium]
MVCRLIKTVRLGGLLTVVLFVGCLGLCSDSANGQNRIQRENALPGAIDWQLTRVKIVGSGCRSVPVEAYCSRQSVLAGETIDIMASTSPARAFRLEIFRTGWYGGRGARLMQTIERVDCGTQPDPVPGEKNLHECRWKPSVSLTIPG